MTRFPGQARACLPVGRDDNGVSIQGLPVIPDRFAVAKQDRESRDGGSSQCSSSYIKSGLAAAFDLLTL